MTGIAVVGAGYWGPNLIRNFAAAPGAELIRVVDQDEQRCRQAVQSCPGVSTGTRYGQILEDEAVEAVVLATPAGTHFELTRQALEAGKHVFVEKPLAGSSQECLELVQRADEQNRILMVGHTFEFNAAVLRVEDYIRRGELGEIYYLYCQRLNLGVVRTDVNALWNLAPHDVSIALRWLGALPVTVRARGYTYLQPGVEDVVYLDLEFASGVAVHIHCSWLDPGKVRRITVVGSRKMVVYDDTSPDAKIQLYDRGMDRRRTGESLGHYDSFGSFQLIKRAGDVLIPRLDFVEPLRLECRHFIECIRTGETPITDGRNGLRVVRVLEAGTRSMRQGGAAVPLESDV